MRRLLRVLAVTALFIGLLPVQSAAADTSAAAVYTEMASFVADTGAAAVPFPTNADTALPSKPFDRAPPLDPLVDYSCDMPSISLGGGDVEIVNPTGNWICFIGAGWNAGSANTNPDPRTPTIVNNGEDDYRVELTFAEPQQAVGFGLLTNAAAHEAVTIHYDNGDTETVADAALDTEANQFEFFGFWSYRPIVKVELDTTDGHLQNEGITGIWTSPFTWTESCPRGEYFVSAEGTGENTPVVSVPAAAGYPYAITVHGTYFAGGRSLYDIAADAEYSQDWYQRMNLMPWTDELNGYEGFGEGLLELKVDGEFVEWGPFAADHRYSIEYLASGPIDLQIYDIYAQNNTGGLCVDVEPLPLTHVNGGGQIIEQPDGAKPLKVSFGGWLQDIDGGLVCEWQVDFHNVGNDSLDKSKFHATRCRSLSTFPGGDWDGIVSFRAYGTLDGEPGYRAIFRMEDYTEPGDMDTLRIELYNGADEVYDTSDGDFADESTNVGKNRTRLDRGNIQVRFFE